MNRTTWSELLSSRSLPMWTSRITWSIRPGLAYSLPGGAYEYSET